MAPPTFKQQVRRARFETMIGFATPLLDLVLAAGDRVSRIAGPPDDYIAIRASSDAFELDAAKRGSGSQIDD